MRYSTALDTRAAVAELRNAIRRSRSSRYDHRVEAVLLVARGVSCPDAARLLLVSRRSVENWVRRFITGGLAALEEARRSGRPPRLSEAQLAEVGAALRESPEQSGMTGRVWSGRLLSNYLAERHQVRLGLRQCQRVIRRFRLLPCVH